MRTRSRLAAIVGIAVALIGATTGAAGASPGALDQTFGTGGTVTTRFTNSAEGHALSVQNNGKIVVSGAMETAHSSRFAVARYLSNGTLDTSFSGDGQTTTVIGTNAAAYGSAIQSDGKIVVAGTASNGSSNDFALVRYTKSGTVDPTFGSNGRVLIDFLGHDDVARAVRVISNSTRILVGGTSNDGSGDIFGIARLKLDGTLDTTFGFSGLVFHRIGPGNGDADDMAIQSDGKIVMVGSTSDPTLGDLFAVARFTDTGSIDPSFGTNGVVTTSLVRNDVANGVAIQSDGKIVAAGVSNGFGPSSDFGVVRYTTTGALDATFGSGGKVITDVGGVTDVGQVVRISSGAILVAGLSYQGSPLYDFALVRYTSAGALDTTFGSGGKVLTPFASDSEAYAMRIQADGKIVVAGRTFVDGFGGYAFAVARYLAT